MKTKEELEGELRALREQLKDPITPDFLAESIKTNAIPKIEAEIAALRDTTKEPPKEPTKVPKKQIAKNKLQKPKVVQTEEYHKPKKLSWKYGISYADLFPHGKVFKLETSENCTEQLGILLREAEEVFVYGDVDIVAKKGDLAVMVRADEKYRLYNVVGNPHDKCLKMAELQPDGSTIETRPYFGDKKATNKPLNHDDTRELDPIANATLPAPATESTTDKKQLATVEQNIDQTETESTNTEAEKLPADTVSASVEQPTKVAIAKAKPQHPEHFATESSTFKAVADVLAIFAMTAQIGVADKVVAKVLRRASDDRIILEVRDAVHRSGIFKAKPQSEKHYFLVEEKSKYLKPIAEPKTAVIIIDSKKEALEEGETATGNILDLLYGNPKELEKCFELQSAVHTCKSGGKCSAEEKKKLQQAAHDCSTKYKKGLGKYVVFVAERTQLFQTALRGLKKVETVKLANAIAKAEQPDTPQLDAPYPMAMDSPAKRALYDAIQDENLVLRVDEAVLTTRKAEWLKTSFKQRNVYAAIRPLFTDEEEAEKVFEIVKKQYEN